MSKGNKILSSEITSETTYNSRRSFVKQLGLAGGGLGVAGLGAVGASSGVAYTAPADDDPLTPEEIVTSYNNFYEFGVDKSDPAKHAHQLTTKPWQVEVAGHAEKTGTFDFDDLIKGLDIQDRVYRLRCVEAWSMVVPWLGVELGALLKKLEPKSDAKYVEFTTLERPKEMPGQRSLFSGIDWPYTEGLRLDEAYNPLALMATGLYGKALPNQNGAPLRLVVPWKYGFKSIKSIVKIRFTKRMPRSTWNILAPKEYGFYANVNPQVPHPRWSQATERRLPSSLFNPNRRDTLLFNGYAEDVAGLYANMNLRRNF